MGSRGFLIKTMLKIFVIFAACVVVSFSFSCEPCKKSTCQRPSYCKSGAYVKDPCQCCDECARAKNVGDLGISMAGAPLDSRVKLQIVEIISRHLMDTVTTLENVSEEGCNLNHSHSKDHQIHFGNFGLTSLGFRIPKA